MDRQFKSLYLQQARVVESVCEEAVRGKLIRNIRPDAAAFAISDLTRGMIIQRLLGWSQAGVEEDIEFIFNLVWKGIAGR